MHAGFRPQRPNLVESATIVLRDDGCISDRPISYKYLESKLFFQGWEISGSVSV
jgi:hypothetical protein